MENTNNEADNVQAGPVLKRYYRGNLIAGEITTSETDGIAYKSFTLEDESGHKVTAAEFDENYSEVTE